MPIKIPGFTQVKGDYVPKSLNIVSQGLDDSGKTDWACTAPEPIVYIGLDRGVGEVVNSAVKRYGKNILLKEISVPVGEDQEVYVPIWKETREHLQLIPASGAKTVVVDTASRLWELCRLAKFGALEQIPQHRYTKVNAMFESLLDHLFEARDLNVILIHQLKKEYKGRIDEKTQKEVSFWTGGWERQGFNKLNYMANLILEHRRSEDGAFKIKLLKCKGNKDMWGQEYEVESYDFAGLAAEIYPDSSLEDWQ